MAGCWLEPVGGLSPLRSRLIVSYARALSSADNATDARDKDAATRERGFSTALSAE